MVRWWSCRGDIDDAHTRLGAMNRAPPWPSARPAHDVEEILLMEYEALAKK